MNYSPHGGSEKIHGAALTRLSFSLINEMLAFINEPGEPLRCVRLFFLHNGKCPFVNGKESGFAFIGESPENLIANTASTCVGVAAVSLTGFHGERHDGRGCINAGQQDALFLLSTVGEPV